jgi:hypothetical protein
MAAAVDGFVFWLRTLIGRQRKRNEQSVRDAYRRLFFDDDGVTMKPDALVVLEDLGRASRIGKVSHLSSDSDLRAYEGMRTIFIHIIARFELSGRVDAERLSNQIKELENDD